jgi:geranylgeranyl pyrophosphate synthase
LGLEEAKTYAQSLLNEALEALRSTGLTHTHTLAALAERVVNRNT